MCNQTRLSGNTLRRDYIDNGNGWCTQLPTGNHKTVEFPTTCKAPVPISEAVKHGCKVFKKSKTMKNYNVQCNENELAYLQQLRNNGSGINPSVPQAIKIGEDVSGNAKLSRLEEGSIHSGQADMEITVSLSNTTTTAIRNVVFDGHNYANIRNSYGVLPVGMVVDGTFGNITLAQLKQVTTINPFRLHGAHVTNTIISTSAESTSFFTRNSLYLLRAKPDNTSIERKLVSFKKALRANQFRTNIQYIDTFRALIDGFAALEFNIEADNRIDFTFELSAWEGSYNMVKHT